jgi:hypothetical protein
VSHISQSQIAQLGVGVKDTSKSLFGVWGAMLHLPRQAAAAATQPSQRAARLEEMYSMLQDAGEYELLAAGLQENLHVRG